MTLLDEIRLWADEGEQHGIPRCCGLRFGFSAARPKFFSVLGFPVVSAKLKKYSPRMLAAYKDQQGWVPCEGHLLWWLVTGRLFRGS